MATTIFAVIPTWMGTTAYSIDSIHLNKTDAHKRAHTLRLTADGSDRIIVRTFTLDVTTDDSSDSPPDWAMATDWPSDYPDYNGTDGGI